MSRIGGLIGLLAILGLGVGCMTSARHSTHDGLYGGSDRPRLHMEAARAATLEESLFKEDQAVISNQDISRILASPIVLPQDARLAVIQFGHRPRWWYWSEDFTRMNEQIHTEFITTLSGATRVRDVAYLPAMMIPRQMTIPMLRQSAARFQANMFIVYRTSSQTYARQRAFSRNETRAYCTIEAILVDTRTGIIPFSVVVTEHFSAKRERDDLDFAETVARAEQQAVGRAMLEMATKMTDYLEGLPAAEISDGTDHGPDPERAETEPRSRI